MNNLVKEILIKNRLKTDENIIGVSDVVKAMIEICELQKQECAKNFNDLKSNTEMAHYGGSTILKSKNIAE